MSTSTYAPCLVLKCCELLPVAEPMKVVRNDRTKAKVKRLPCPVSEFVASVMLFRDERVDLSGMHSISYTQS
ncbi:hypothetical protein H310_09947 [Aphanomyces invadans]|uniref:Uncharacterized protein n=1 Tax=Aphanomyces invadans TaxID=157072 RepID=A0A024TSL3_9STRA|nr:hypothetical protein H310_09947 [Aphanomyces invadans]ETV97145.1 hypothetical protein H310_09947 [Aphanomyces invadans]|eukprot:XP_008874391.1 hypothetical protein H310_09947 [Aphanomyces invadans]